MEYDSIVICSLLKSFFYEVFMFMLVDVQNIV
jgi:hypothetical protein